jgi:hypothetical protein
VLAPKVLALRNGMEVAGLDPATPLPPVILAASCRSVYDLIAEDGGDRLAYHRINKSLAGTRWTRRGIYCVYGGEREPAVYEALFRRFLENGFLLPPGPQSPLILPGGLSEGSQVKLAELLLFDP